MYAPDVHADAEQRRSQYGAERGEEIVQACEAAYFHGTAKGDDGRVDVDQLSRHLVPETACKSHPSALTVSCRTHVAIREWSNDPFQARPYEEKEEDVVVVVVVVVDTLLAEWFRLTRGRVQRRAAARLRR